MSKNFKERLRFRYNKRFNEIFHQDLSDVEKNLTPDTTLFDTIGRKPKTKVEKSLLITNRKSSKVFKTKYSHKGLNGVALNNKRNVVIANRAITKKFRQRLKRELQKDLNDSQC